MDFETARVLWDELVYARDLTFCHIGKTIGAFDEIAGVDYPITIWYFVTESDGSVTLWLRHGAVPGRPAREDTWTVPPDYLVEFIKVDESTRTPVRD